MNYKKWVLEAIDIFEKSIKNFQADKSNNIVINNINNPFEKGHISWILYQKNYVDNIQWYLEDLIRDPYIDPKKALEIKRHIDILNQERTNLVEFLDDKFLELFEKIPLKSTATINTESPAWAVDRLSILQLKRYHMALQINRANTTIEHRDFCKKKQLLLEQQHNDMIEAITVLLEDLSKGNKQMKVYRQVKMYNDPSLNPVLYQQNKCE